MVVYHPFITDDARDESFFIFVNLKMSWMKWLNSWLHRFAYAYAHWALWWLFSKGKLMYSYFF